MLGKLVHSAAAIALGLLVVGVAVTSAMPGSDLGLGQRRKTP